MDVGQYINGFILKPAQSPVIGSMLSVVTCQPEEFTQTLPTELGTNFCGNNKLKMLLKKCLLDSGTWVQDTKIIMKYFIYVGTFSVLHWLLAHEIILVGMMIPKQAYQKN